MCRYGYYYYATCRHQQTVLFDFCDKATPAAPIAIRSPHRAKPALFKGPWVKGQAQTANKQQQQDQPRKRGSGASKQSKKHPNATQQRIRQEQHASASTAREEYLRASPAHPLRPYQQSTSSFRSIGSAPITEEPTEDLYLSSSLTQQHHTQQDSSTAAAAATDEMAGLRPFGHAFRHWVGGGGPGQQAPHSTDSSSARVSASHVMRVLTH